MSILRKKQRERICLQRGGSPLKYINQLRILAELRKLDLQIDEIMESISKYLNEENDYFVVKAKRKIVENLLKETDMAFDKIAKIAGVTIDFVVNIQQKLSSDK